MVNPEKEILNGIHTVSNRQHCECEEIVESQVPPSIARNVAMNSIGIGYLPRSVVPGNQAHDELGLNSPMPWAAHENEQCKQISDRDGKRTKLTKHYIKEQDDVHRTSSGDLIEFSASRVELKIHVDKNVEDTYTYSIPSGTYSSQTNGGVLVKLLFFFEVDVCIVMCLLREIQFF